MNVPTRTLVTDDRGRWQTLILAALVIWSLTPLFLLIVVSGSGGWHFPALFGATPGVDGWRSLGVSGSRLASALWTSVALGLGVGGIASFAGLVLGRAIAEQTGWPRSLGAAAAFLPVAAPQLALGVGLQFTFLWSGLAGSGLGVLLAHLVPAVGYTTLFFIGVFVAFDFRIEEEAQALGANRLQRLIWVTGPLLRRPLAEAFILGFLVSWAQVPLTLLIGQGRVRTLTVEVLTWVQAGQDPLAAAGSLALVIPPIVLMTITTIAFARAEVVAP